MKAEEAASIGFDQLSAHYRPFIEHMIRAYYVPRAHLDDLRQEAQIVMWRCHENVRKGHVNLRYSFEAYLRQAILNRLIDLSRSAAHRPVEYPLKDAGIMPDDNNGRAFRDAEIRAHLESVPLSGDARLLVCIVLDDARDYRERFIERIGGVGGRARFAGAKGELDRAMRGYRT